MSYGRDLQIAGSKVPSYELSTIELSPNTPDKDELKQTAQPEDIDTNVHPTCLPDYGAEANDPSGPTPRRGLTRRGWQSVINNTPCYQSTTLRAQRLLLKQKNLSKPFIPRRERRSIQFAVDIANTRLTFGTETSPSTTFRVEMSSNLKSIPELSTPATRQLDKVVETKSFWSSLWGALTSLF